MTYSTVDSGYHLLSCSIATDKVLVEKQEEIEMLQEKIRLLTLQLIEREEKISQLIKKMKSKQLLDNCYCCVYKILYSNYVLL